ncbi:DUF1194 domain-containing protein [Falsiroseomonas sp. HW251]|uniref:DUF1194 domain-containing protein n=1 Tax=Falsiroseomonas sp. HW251 TaxID=3390998 RepID=UPI003D3215B0
MTLPACLVAIVLLIDASGSVPDPLYAAQRDGPASAFEDPRLIRTLERSDGIAVLLADFDAQARTRVPWTLIRTRDDAAAFATAVRAIRRTGRSGVTAVGRALAHANAVLAEAPCTPANRMVDISTDGIETDSRLPAPFMRDAAADAGTVINAIAFLDPALAASPEFGADEILAESEAWLRDHVATGFVRIARGAQGFEESFRAKVIVEVTSLEPPIPDRPSPPTGGRGLDEGGAAP